MRLPLELVWVWVALTVPAWPLVARYSGALGVACYSIAAGAALLLAPRIAALIPVRRAMALWLAMFAIVVVLFAVVYPRVNVHQPGAGSDDDDAHNIGAMALVAGESPYARTTYLGNELHQLPGSFVLSIPFALIGTSALQNVVCLPLFFLLLRRETRDARTPLVIALLSVLLSPAVLHQVATGSSYSWNAIWVLAGLWWVTARPSSLLAPLVLGVALCSRANFILLLAPLLGWLWRTHGPAVAMRIVGLAALVVAALAIPFYLTSDAFGPLSVIDRWRDYDIVVPGAGVAVVIGMAMLSIGLAFFRAGRSGFFLQCALVQSFPVVAGLMLSWLMPADHDRLAMAYYGSFASWFVLIGATMRIEPWLVGEGRPVS